jgi:hypothetical protein
MAGLICNQEPGPQKVPEGKLAAAKLVFDDFAAEYLDIWQEIGEKWAIAVNSQPTSLLSSRFLG